jgi:hypothetical protein
MDSEKWKKKAREVYLQPLEENADPYGVVSCLVQAT